VESTAELEFPNFPSGVNKETSNQWPSSCGMNGQLNAILKVKRFSLIDYFND